MTLRTDEQNLVELLSANKKELDRIVLDFLPVTHENTEIGSLYEMMRDYPSRGGKGLRGSLCLLWTELFGGKREDALITSAALELFQNWILIHDDIEDESDLRRGSPALHKKYGVELSINAGDALHGKMWGLLLRNEQPLGPQPTLRVLSEFNTMIDETTEGQQMELGWTRNKKWEITESDYLLMVTKKAAWYTCITPARLGLIISEHVNKRRDKTSEIRLLENIVDFGKSLGISFQIVDDILNLTADESKYGKEILGDIFEGKRTLMLIHLLGVARESEKSKILDIMSRPRQEKTKSDAEFIFGLMKHSGSIEYARRLAKEHSNRALAKFEEIVSSEGVARSDVYAVTHSLLRYMTDRDY